MADNETTGRATFRDVDLRAVGRQMRMLRRSKNWSLRDLAATSGVSLSAIRNIEAGNSNPSLLTMLAIVEALGEPIDGLINAARQHREQIVVTRAAGREPAATTPASEAGLGGSLRDQAMSAKVVSIEPDTAFARNDRDGTAIFGYVLDGRVIVSHADNLNECRGGDAFHLTDSRKADIRTGPNSGARLVIIRDTVSREKDEQSGQGRGA